MWPPPVMLTFCRLRKAGWEEELWKRSLFVPSLLAFKVMESTSTPEMIAEQEL